MIVGEVVIIGTALTTLSVMVLLAVEKFASAAWLIVICVVPTPLMVTEPEVVILATLLSAIWKENAPVLLEVALTSNPGSPNILSIVSELIIVGVNNL